MADFGKFESVISIDLIDFLLENDEVSEKFLHNFEILGMLKGNLGPVDDYLEEIAYKNLDYKLQ